MCIRDRLLGLLILVFRQLGHRFSYNVIFATAAIGTVASNLYMLTQLRLRLLRTTLLLVFLFHVVTDMPTLNIFHWNAAVAVASAVVFTFLAPWLCRLYTTTATPLSLLLLLHSYLYAPFAVASKLMLTA